MAHALYYSNRCDFSKEVLGLISRRNIQPLVQLVCVDTAGFSSLPPVVDRVPLVITANGNVLVDDDVVLFLEMLPPPRAPPAAACTAAPGAPPSSNSNISGVAAASDCGVLPLLAQGDVEWTLFNEDQDIYDGVTHPSQTHFGYIAEAQQSVGLSEAFANVDTQKRLKTDTAALDRLVSERDNDLAAIRKNMARV